MSKWVSGQQLLTDFGINELEFFTDYLQKGLQPYNDLGRPISPSYIVDKITNIARLKEQYDEKRYSVADAGVYELKKFDATVGHDLLAQIENYDKWAVSVRDLDWNEFELPEMEAEARAVLVELVGSVYHIEDINKFFDVPEIELEKQEPAKAIRPSTKDKLEVQRVFQELLKKYPEFDTIKEFRNLPEIMEAGGKHYSEERRQIWISKVAPERLKRPGIRPKKK